MLEMQGILKAIYNALRTVKVCGDDCYTMSGVFNSLESQYQSLDEVKTLPDEPNGGDEQ